MTYVIDTHPLVWHVEDDPRLSPRVQTVLDDPSSRIVIPAMVLVEVKYLYTAKRIKTNLADLIQRLARLTNCSICPLDEEVVEYVPENLNIHDAIIVATALVYRDVLGHQVNLITKDRRIRDSKLIEVLW